MNCRGKFVYRGFSKTDAGSFVNSNGEKIDYPASYKLKVDENTENGVQERVFKVAIDSVVVSQIANLKPYSEISVDFDVQLFSNSVRLIPIAISPLHNK